MDRTIAKIDFRENVGLTVSFKAEHPEKEGVITNTTQTVYAEPTEGFTDAMKKLKEALVKTTALGLFEHAIENKTTDEVRKYLRRVSSKLSVTGCTIKYDEGELVGIKIRGKYENKVGDVLAINSPMIVLDGSDPWGWEGILKANVETLLEATERYLDGEFNKHELAEKE